MADSLRLLETHDNEPILLALIGGGSLSSFFDEAANLNTLRTSLEGYINTLTTLKTGSRPTKTPRKASATSSPRSTPSLPSKRRVLISPRGAQTKLLADTKNKESTYQAQIAQKQAQQAKFEQDLLSYEAQLNLSVSVGSIPKAGSGVLQWPVASPYITQYFGNTDFATQNPQVYGGKGHNAIDLRASPGTPIMAAPRRGSARHRNTDLTCPGASYGKWIFIKHDNGLSTIYAHLSTFLVSAATR